MEWWNFLLLWEYAVNAINLSLFFPSLMLWGSIHDRVVWQTIYLTALMFKHCVKSGWDCFLSCIFFFLLFIKIWGWWKKNVMSVLEHYYNCGHTWLYKIYIAFCRYTFWKISVWSICGIYEKFSPVPSYL